MQNKINELRVANQASNLLGECPVWCEVRQSLFWIDIKACVLHEMKWPENRVQMWKMPEPIGMMVLKDQNNLFLALQNGLIHFNLNNCEIEWILDIEREMPNNRANDGKCDAKGRIWVGTMNVNAIDSTGSLYIIDTNFELIKKKDNLTISNGLAWSADNKKMFFIDSSTFRVETYSFDLQLGLLEFEKIAINIPENLGMPDGMTIDEKGMLWIAHWNGFAVRRWNPYTGKLLNTIKLPVPQITSVAFGGKDLNELFITTAKDGLSKEQLHQYPLSGHLFTIKLPVAGFKANYCSLNL